MYLITRQAMANEAADKWAEQYPKDDHWGKDERKQEIATSLVELGEEPKPEDVDRVIGNTSWTRTTCDECEAENIDVVRLGQPLDYESKTADICKGCLSEALRE